MVERPVQAALERRLAEPHGGGGVSGRQSLDVAQHQRRAVLRLEIADRPLECGSQLAMLGGAGVSDDVPLAQMYPFARTLRLADGPDEVHLRDIARAELKKHLS